MNNTTSNTTSEPLSICRQALQKNGFEVFLAANPNEAKQIFFKQILPELKVTTAAWGDSQTLCSTGILEELFDRSDIETIKTFEAGVDRGVLLQRRRQALLSDLFLAGSNAVTQTGRLVNLDMIGNRIAPVIFGAKKVVLLIGRNKIVSDLEQAMERIKTYAAPTNAQRHQLKTPCAKTGRCHDCNSPDRICNSWSIIDKCFPPKRIKVILLNTDLGL